MSDLYNIGAAIETVSELFFIMSRATGRSLHMESVLQDGDILVVKDGQDAQRYERFAKSNDCRLRIVMDDTFDLYAVYDKLRGDRSRIILDHRWVESYYRRGISMLGDALDGFNEQVSPADLPPPPSMERDPRFPRITL